MKKDDAKTVFIDTSASDGVQIALHMWLPAGSQAGSPVKTAVVLSHGMAEHAMRYEGFARFLCENGIAFYAHDHRGHGQTAKNADELGFLAEKDGFQAVVLDLRSVVERCRSDLPNAKIILLGHSFGSFVAQSFIEQFGNEVDGCILSGTAGPRRLLSAAGNRMASLVKLFKGAHYRSKFLDRASFSSYLDKIPNAKSPFAWLSRDDEQVALYEKDPLCGFLCTAGFFYDLTAGLCRIHREKNMKRIPKTLPVLFFAGTGDPVGGYTKTIRALADRYRKNGMTDVSEIYYEGGRHEMLNETNSVQVQDDILEWIQKHWYKN